MLLTIPNLTRSMKERGKKQLLTKLFRRKIEETLGEIIQKVTHSFLRVGWYSR